MSHCHAAEGVKKDIGRQQQQRNLRARWLEQDSVWRKRERGWWQRLREKCSGWRTRERWRERTDERRKQVIHYWGTPLDWTTEMHTDTHSCNHTHWEAGAVGVSGHTLLAGESDSLLPNKNHEEDEGQSFLHISSSSCLRPTDTY